MVKIVRLTTRHQRTERQLAAEAAEHLRCLSPELLQQLPGEARLSITKAVYALHRHARPDEPGGLWSGGFIMLSRDQTEYVWEQIRKLKPEDRPVQVRDAFMVLMLNIRTDTGECVLTREEIAEKIGCRPNHISAIMSTLVRMGVLRRDLTRVEGMRGRGVVTYVVNPEVAWNGSLDVRKATAAETGAPLLKLMQGGITEPNEGDK